MCPAAVPPLRPITSSHIESLSEEVLLEILSYLSISELLTAARISQRFNRLCDEPQLWRRIYHSLFTADRLKHPFSPALDQRLRGSIESRSCKTQMNRKGKRKHSEATQHDGELHLGHTWKTLCRISLNWKRGSAGLTRITPIINHPDSTPPIPTQALTTTILSRSQDSKSPTPNTIVRFHRSLLFIARKSRSPTESLPTVYVYNLQDDFNQQQRQKQSILVGKLSPELGSEDAPMLAAQGVTEISIDESCGENSGTSPAAKSTLLVSVFYTTGQFTIYEINLLSLSPNAVEPTIPDFQQVGSCQPSLPAKSSGSRLAHYGSVETAKFHFPLLVTCSVDFHLSFFRLSWPSSTTTQSNGNLQIVKLPLDMQNHSCYWPLSLSLKRSEPLSERFRMTIAYPMPFYPSAWTVGLQEFDFEVTSSRSSSFSLKMNTNRFVTALQHPQDKDRRPMAGLSLGEIVIGIEQAAENVIVGRSDNTIDCFRLAPLSDGSEDEQRMKRLSCSKTLFGHTSRIGSISVDENGRCVSGAMDGVKVWEGSEAVDVRSVESPPAFLGESRSVGWIGSDSEKIVSLWISDDFDSHGKPARLNEEIRVLSFI